MTSSTARQCYGHNRTYCKRVSIGKPFVNWSLVPSKIDTRALIRNPKALKPSNGQCFAGDPVSPSQYHRSPNLQRGRLAWIDF
jgi:hypothetical protein